VSIVDHYPASIPHLTKKVSLFLPSFLVPSVTGRPDLCHQSIKRFVVLPFGPIREHRLTVRVGPPVVFVSLREGSAIS